MISHLRGGCFGTHPDIMLEAVFLLAFSGCLRGGEFTTRTNQFTPGHDLCRGDISFHPDHFTLFLKHSKSDRLLKGTKIVIGRQDTGLCPFSAMLHYISLNPDAPPDSPLS